MQTHSLALSSAPSSALMRVAPKPPPVRVPKVETLADLYAALAVIEDGENADAVLALSELRMDDDGLIAIPGHGEYALTNWARRQLAEQLGIKWERWFALLGPGERAQEINLRLQRSPGQMRLRTADQTDELGTVVPTLRAFVSPIYTPFSDKALAGLLADVLGSTKHRVARVSVTDMTVSYALYIGHPVRPGDDSKVGDLQGGIFVRNSGVGFASLAVTSHLLRLICLNGMLMPIKDPTLVACVHRYVTVEKVRAQLAERANDIGGAFTAGAARLLASRRHDVGDREVAFLDLLKRARLGKKQLPVLEAAYAREPEASVFGIVQAATRAAQDFEPEPRYELERAATGYLTAHAVS